MLTNSDLTLLTRIFKELLEQNNKHLATKADLVKLEVKFEARFERLEGRFDSLEKSFEKFRDEMYLITDDHELQLKKLASSS